MTKGVPQDKRLSTWDAGQLSRFCEVAYTMARRQFGARLNVLPNIDDPTREVVLTALMEETEIIAENLIILALDYGHLNAKNLRQKPQDGEAKKPRRSVILTEEVD